MIACDASGLGRLTQLRCIDVAFQATSRPLRCTLRELLCTGGCSFITDLERKNVELEQLVRLVAQLPRPESGPLDSTMTTSPAAKRRAARAEALAEGGGGPAALDGPAVSR